MKKFTTLDNEVLADWQKAFRLNYHWGEKAPSIIAATLALGTLNHVIPSGYYLVKQKLEVQDVPPLDQKITLKGHLSKKLPSKTRYLVCRSDIVCLEKTIISLSAVLIQPEIEPVLKNSKLPGTTYSSYGDFKYWRTFTRDEVNAFASLSGDTNNIHTGEYPVVQGMLILLALEDYLALNNQFFKNVEIYYLKPVRINNPVKLYKEGEILYGITGDSVCFKLNFREEK